MTTQVTGKKGVVTGPPPFVFGTQGHHYLLVERPQLIGHLPIATVDAFTAHMILRRAIAANGSLATDIQRRFTKLFPASGVTKTSLAGIAAVADNLLARGSLVLVDLGPSACIAPSAPTNLPIPATCEPLFRGPWPLRAGGLSGNAAVLLQQARLKPLAANHVESSTQGTGPARPAPPPPSYPEKLGVVLAGVLDVPANSIEQEFRKDFQRLKDELTSSRGLIGIIVYALAAWAAAHLLGPVGWVIDGVLLGLAISAIGWAAFDWFRRIAVLLIRIDRAQTIAELKACSVELVNLIVEIGMSAFVALVTRAAARKIPKIERMSSESADLESRAAQTKLAAVSGSSKTERIQKSSLSDSNGKTDRSHAVQSGVPIKVSINDEHIKPHLNKFQHPTSQVFESVISDLNTIKNETVINSAFRRQILIDKVTYRYHAYTFANGDIRVGTIYVP